MDPENRFSMPEEFEQEIIKLHAPLISTPHPLQLQIRCKRGSSTSEPTGPPTPQLGPVFNFGVVAEGIYRSSFPQPCNLDHLQSLGLKTIVTLVEETYALESTNYVQSNGITHLRIPIIAHKSSKSINALEKIAEVQLVLRDTSRHPVLVHCNKGKHRTGCMIAAFRKLNGGLVEDIINEYRHYAGRKARLWDEHFINTMPTSLLREIMRVGPSTLAGSLIANDWHNRIVFANKQKQDTLGYATPPRSDEGEGEDDSPWPPNDLKWVCDDGTREDMNPS